MSMYTNANIYQLKKNSRFFDAIMHLEYLQRDGQSLLMQLSHEEANCQNLGLAIIFNAQECISI